MIRRLAKITILYSLIATTAHAQKIIIDCDPGVDDAIAIILAMEYSNFEILGITTVFGNAAADQATANALRIVELSGRNIPVYAGAERPWSSPRVIPPTLFMERMALGIQTNRSPFCERSQLQRLNLLLKPSTATRDKLQYLRSAG